MLAPEKKIILRCFFFSTNWFTCVPNFNFLRHQQQFFLPIDITFFANIGLEYFSNNFLRVFHQSQLELPDLDQNWAKTSPLLLQIFESSNCVDSHIVQWSTFALLKKTLEACVPKRGWPKSQPEGETWEWLPLPDNYHQDHLFRVHHCFASGAWQTKMNLWTASTVCLRFQSISVFCLSWFSIF